MACELVFWHNILSSSKTWAAHRQSVKVISSAIVIEIVNCLVICFRLKLPERLGQKELHFLHSQLYLPNFPMLQEPKIWSCFWFSFLSACGFYSYMFFILLQFDCYRLQEKNCSATWNIPSVNLPETSVTWLLAVRVELNALTLPVVPFSLVQLNFFKGCSNYSFRRKRERRIVILWVARSLSHWSVMLQSQILDVCSPLSMQQAVELNFQRSDILLTL